ncbi:MAG: ABC transporter permease [Candidatus Buchananbacteria bacterium]|nr:ABC transporter permease [Candidatus Buchananbacteria bacterium]
MNLVTLKIALRALSSHKSRTFLTVLGIVIGIAAVVAVMSAGQGIKALVVDQVESFGSDLIQTEIKVPSAKKNSSENAFGIASGIEVTTLKLSDRDAIMKLPNIKDSYAGSTGQELVSYNGQNQQALLYGVSATFINIDKGQVETGRFFTNEEDNGLANVAVIGQKVKDKLFNNGQAIDKLIKIGKQKFRVIGVMEKRGATFGFDMDNMIYIPVQTLQKKIMGVDYIMFITSQVRNPDLIDQTVAEMEQLLRERHDITDPDKEDFAVTSIAEALDMLNTIFWAISVLLIAVAGISLVVGGIGIMNIMYVSVMERTYEIGLRKSVGATNNNILFQFLWEAVIVTFLGAIIGVLIGVLFAWLVSVVATSQGFAWKFVVLPSSLALASGVAIAIGLSFGVFPAKTAANMDPVTALRYNR